MILMAASPVPAGEPRDARGGPLARAIAYEAARAATADDNRTTFTNPAPRDSKSAPSDWSLVRQLKQGSEIVLAAAGRAPGARYVLLTDDSGLTVLNVANLAIPVGARRVLIDWAQARPGYFVAAQQGATFRQDKEDLRLGPDGVFVREQKVADLDRLVETIRRDEVAQIGAMRKRLSRHVGRGAMIGAGIGAVWGGLAAASASPDSEYHNAVPAVMMGTAGAGIGALVGTYVGAVIPRRLEIVYRAME